MFIKNYIRFFLKRYGHNFREMREMTQLSQLDVVKKVHCSQAVISHIENGYYLPSPSFEKELLDFYNHFKEDNK